jgi:hypothetical protein
VALVGGWSVLWHYAAGKAEATIAAWRAREARAGRVYTCGRQTIGGFPLRIAIDCEKAAALFRGSRHPLEMKTMRIVAAAELYEPNVLASTFTGPLAVAAPGHAPDFIADWRSLRSNAYGTPSAPTRVSIVLDHLRFDRLHGGVQQNLLSARRIDFDGRIVAGSASHHPVIEVVLRFFALSAPGLNAAAVAPIDADITAVLRGLSDFSPKPWPERFRAMQAAGGRIAITKARVAQGETVAVGSGTLTLDARGQLEGQLRITIAGAEPFLMAIGAQRAVQTSQPMDKLAGALDRLAPGLGDVARLQDGANLSFGLDLIAEHTTLEGRRALTLPLRFSGGRIFLGPIAIGKTPALF